MFLEIKIGWNIKKDWPSLDSQDICHGKVMTPKFTLQITYISYVFSKSNFLQYQQYIPHGSVGNTKANTEIMINIWYCEAWHWAEQKFWLYPASHKTQQINAWFLERVKM